MKTNTNIKANYLLAIECDIRDIQLFTGIIEDDSEVYNSLQRVSSNTWEASAHSLCEVEDLQNQIDEMVDNTGVQIYTEITERLPSGRVINFNTNTAIPIIQNRSTKIAQEVAKGLGITDAKTILEIKAIVAGELTMNPERSDEDVACDCCFMP